MADDTSSSIDIRPPYCRTCGRDLFASALAADRARIAAAIRGEHDRIRDDGHWYPNDVMHLCDRLLRVVEGG